MYHVPRVGLGSFACAFSVYSPNGFNIPLIYAGPIANTPSVVIPVAVARRSNLHTAFPSRKREWTMFDRAGVYKS